MPFRIATVQLPITGDARANGRGVRASMREAAEQGARLVQFPEGMLSGYAKNPIQDWAEVNWSNVRAELEAVLELARALRLWVVPGSVAGIVLVRRTRALWSCRSVPVAMITSANESWVCVG
jgi:predicted amidohydrolase